MDQHALPTVHFFWHGPPLSRLERLCLASFVAHGHPVDLYVYDEPQGVPPGVNVVDAQRILPRDTLFHHRRTGSVALFADWFRYRLLFKQGGIWADTDMVCLKPLAFQSRELFAWQDTRLINIALLGLPAGHSLAVWMAQVCEAPNKVLPYDGFGSRVRKWRRRVLQGNRRDRIRWGEYGPKGFTLAARHFQYAQKALTTETFYPVACEDWQTLFSSGGAHAPPWFEDSYAVHLWNNMMHRAGGFDKNGAFPADSPFERLCREYL